VAFAANSMYWLKPGSPGYPKPPSFPTSTIYRDALPSVNPNTYGPRQPNLVGVGAAPAPAKKPLPRKTSPLSPMDKLIQTLYSQIETPAQQEARVNRQLDTQMAAQQKLIDNEYERQRQDAMMQFQAQAAAGQAAAAMSKDLFGQVGGEFNAAAGEMKGLSHGLSKGVEGATAKDVAAANAGLAATGNTAIKSGDGGIFSVGGGLQQGVEDYRGGTLPAQMFSTQGEAANFGLAGMLSSQNLKATSDANAALMTSMHDIRANQAKAIDALAAGRADLAHTYLNDAKDAQVKSISLIQGLVAQKQASATATAKLRADAAKTQTKNVLDLAKLKISAGHLTLSEKSLLTRMQGQDFSQQMATTREARLSSASQTRLENAALNQQLALGKVDVNASKAAGFIKRVDGTFLRDAKGEKIPATRLFKPAAAKTMTPGQVATQAGKANDLASELFYGYGKDAKGKRVPISQLGTFDPDNAKTYGTGRATYTSALQTLLRRKVPQATARAALNSVYERGDMGRPFFSPQEKQKIQAAYVKQYGKVQGNQHWTGLLNTLNTQLRNNQTGDFDKLIAQVLQAAGA
jgi:hypothetical protein